MMQSQTVTVKDVTDAAKLAGWKLRRHKRRWELTRAFHWNYPLVFPRLVDALHHIDEDYYHRAKVFSEYVLCPNWWAPRVDPDDMVVFRQALIELIDTHGPFWFEKLKKAVFPHEFNPYPFDKRDRNRLHSYLIRLRNHPECRPIVMALHKSLGHQKEKL